MVLAKGGGGMRVLIEGVHTSPLSQGEKVQGGVMKLARMSDFSDDDIVVYKFSVDLVFS